MQCIPWLLLPYLHVCQKLDFSSLSTDWIFSRWYKREEAQKRYSLFFASTNLAGAFGGLLAAAISNMDGIGNYRAWRWVFILGKLSAPRMEHCYTRLMVLSEGIITCVVAASMYFLIADFPEDVKWLNTEEKAFVKQRLFEDVGDSRIDAKTTFKDVMAVLKDCEDNLLPTPTTLNRVLLDKVMFGALMYFGLIIPGCECIWPSCYSTTSKQKLY